MISSTKLFITKWTLAINLVLFTFISCQKDNNQTKELQAELSSTGSNVHAATPHFNLEVILSGADKRFGHVKFRQDHDAAKVITLDT